MNRNIRIHIILPYATPTGEARVMIKENGDLRVYSASEAIYRVGQLSAEGDEIAADTLFRAAIEAHGLATGQRV